MAAFVRSADVVFIQRTIKIHSPRAVHFCPESRVEHLEITTFRGDL